MNPIENVALPSNLRGESALAAIVFTDVESFTPKMAADEKHTLALIQRDFDIMGQVCDRFDGQVLKSLGDGLLIYFVSAEKAVTAAIEIQKILVATAANLPERDILIHRIGIHLGDVLFSGNDVMGNGVNIAARLQTLAAPGGICISQTVYDVVKTRLSLPATYGGLRKIKGINEPVPVYQIYTPRHLTSTQPHKVFISYRAHEPDKHLAQQFYEALTTAGHQAFMAGESIRLGENWPARIEAELKQSDYLLLLLSEQSATSEMVTEEVRRAKELRDGRSDGKPMILPIRVKLPLSFPVNYNLYGYLDQIQQREWQSDLDTPSLIQEVLTVVEEGRALEASPQNVSISGQVWDSLDSLPLPVAGPELPEGQVGLASAFYVERPPIEERCYEEIVRPGALIRIKAPRQMGKTSLMARVLHQATNLGYRTVALSFQLADSKIFSDLDRFLQWFCANIALDLDLPIRLDDYWSAIFGSKVACKSYFERYLLKNTGSPLALGLDEVDRIFQHPEVAADFFGLLRAWHEESKNREIWKKLRLVVVHSTEAYVPMDINQSPFNVGLPIELPEFNQYQVQDLAQRYELNWMEQEVKILMDLVGGHPYLVRLALYHITRGDIALEELLETAATDGGIYGDHLRRHLWNLQQHPELAVAAKKVTDGLQGVQLESMQAFKLHSMGLVNLQGNLVTPRCNLYRQYFGDRLTQIA